MPKGANPNSHGNNPKLNGEGVIVKGISLTPSQWEFVLKLGNGSATKGLRSLIDFAMSVENIVKSSSLKIDQIRCDGNFFWGMVDNRIVQLHQLDSVPPSGWVEADYCKNNPDLPALWISPEDVLYLAKK